MGVLKLLFDCMFCEYIFALGLLLKVINNDKQYNVNYVEFFFIRICNKKEGKEYKPKLLNNALLIMR